MIQAAERLTKHYGEMLDPVIYETSVQWMQVWEGLKTSLRTTEELYCQLIESNFRWEHLDNQTASRIAILRASRHVMMTGEVDLQHQSPILREITCLLALRDEYLRARENAMRLVMEIAFPAALHTREILRLYNFFLKRTIEHDRIVVDHPRGLGIPRKVPWEVEIAQLAALKRVSDKALRTFMAERFLHLSYAAQKKFLKTFHSKPRLARHKCGTVAPWLADNVPLLRLLSKQWNEHRPRSLEGRHPRAVGKADSPEQDAGGLCREVRGAD